MPRPLRRVLKALWWTVTLQLPRRLREWRATNLVCESGLFDLAFYLDHNPDVVASNSDARLHYVRHGAAERRDPSPLFDTAHYLDRYPDVAQAGVNPLVHFLRQGAAEGRDPNPLFDTAYYLEQNPFVRDSGLNPLLHYVQVGAYTCRNPHPDFDSQAYLLSHPQVAAARVNPLAHYLQSRRADRREASAAPATPAELAVVLHLYYPDLWEEICAQLPNLGEHFDLYVSLCEETGLGFEQQILEDFPRAVVRYFPNRGRDIGPFVEFLRDERLSRYRWICKIHTKKSPHRVDGDRWRRHLYHRVFGAPQIVREIQQAFDEDPRLGLIGPATALERSEESWGSNRRRMEELARRVGLGAKDLELEFFAGSMFWFRPHALEPLRQLDLRIDDFEPESGSLDGTLCHALERMFPMLVKVAGYKALPLDRPRAVRPPKQFKLIAFYLPQYHPIPENDQWWGPGFTEWNAVATARPLYQGHIQPRLPKDLGFYDLRVPETRQSQADLARRYGIHGFCYYYYWFQGRRLLERPLDEMLASSTPDFPFCICWANENWTRRWDGLDDEILIEQAYSPDSSWRFIHDVIPILRDRRYIRYEGKPVLLVYRATALPDVQQTLAMWREECRKQGLGEIHLCAVRFHDVVDVQALGFDAGVDFPPHHVHVESVVDRVPGLDPRFEGWIYDYGAVVDHSLARFGQGYRRPGHRGVMLAWDNTPRRGRMAHIAHGATPAAYRRWLQGTLEQELACNPAPESLVFINAWNEWGEGATLEPDHYFGHGFLEATAEALNEVEKQAAERS